jgi:uncharacterized membrane protein
MAIVTIVMIMAMPLENLRKKMISALFLIPAFIAGYSICYLVMTYKVKQD